MAPGSGVGLPLPVAVEVGVVVCLGLVSLGEGVAETVSVARPASSGPIMSLLVIIPRIVIEVLLVILVPGLMPVT